MESLYRRPRKGLLWLITNYQSKPHSLSRSDFLAFSAGGFACLGRNPKFSCKPYKETTCVAEPSHQTYHPCEPTLCEPTLAKGCKPHKSCGICKGCVLCNGKEFRSVSTALGGTRGVQETLRTTARAEISESERAKPLLPLVQREISRHQGQLVRASMANHL